MAAALVVHGTLDAGLAFDTLQEMYFVYAKIKPFLPKLREMTNSPDFLINMEKLAEGTQESRERVVRVQARIAARFVPKPRPSLSSDIRGCKDRGSAATLAPFLRKLSCGRAESGTWCGRFGSSRPQAEPSC